MKRIQRKRQRDFKLSNLSDNYIYVGRPSKWGNPLKLQGNMIYINASYRRKIFSPWVFFTFGDINYMMELYFQLLDGTKFIDKDLQHLADEIKKLDLRELQGKDLVCWCSLEEKCHGDILIRKCEELFTNEIKKS